MLDSFLFSRISNLLKSGSYLRDFKFLINLLIQKLHYPKLIKHICNLFSPIDRNRKQKPQINFGHQNWKTVLFSRLISWLITLTVFIQICMCLAFVQLSHDFFVDLHYFVMIQMTVYLHKIQITISYIERGYLITELKRKSPWE